MEEDILTYIKKTKEELDKSGTANLEYVVMNRKYYNKVLKKCKIITGEDVKNINQVMGLRIIVQNDAPDGIFRIPKKKELLGEISMVVTKMVSSCHQKETYLFQNQGENTDWKDKYGVINKCTQCHQPCSLVELIEE